MSRAWLEWKDFVLTKGNRTEDVPSTATDRARRTANNTPRFEIAATAAYLVTGSFEQSHVLDFFGDDLNEAFWHGAEPRLRRKHPDVHEELVRRRTR